MAAVFKMMCLDTVKNRDASNGNQGNRVSLSRYISEGKNLTNPNIFKFKKIYIGKNLAVIQIFQTPGIMH